MAVVAGKDAGATDRPVKMQRKKIAPPCSAGILAGNHSGQIPCRS